MNADPFMNIVYLNFQLPARELDWMLSVLLSHLTENERLWVSHEHEYGANAQLHSSLEKVIGRSRTVAIRVLCTQERSAQIVQAATFKDRSMGIQWQIQPLLETGMF